MISMSESESVKMVEVEIPLSEEVFEREATVSTLKLLEKTETLSLSFFSRPRDIRPFQESGGEKIPSFPEAEI